MLLEQYNVEEKSGLLDYIELISFLDTLGCSDSDQIVTQFFENLGRSSWGGDKLTHEEIVDCLEWLRTSRTNRSRSKDFRNEKCPILHS